MAHACNPSYSGDRDQKDCSSKPARAKSSARPYLEKLFTKIGLEGPEFKAKYCKIIIIIIIIIINNLAKVYFL
jgi:hypothetical protein